MIAEVALGVPLRRTFDYRVPEAWAAEGLPAAGTRVIVPFGTRLRGGIVVALKPQSDILDSRLKELHLVTDGPPLFTPELLAFTRWVADYYLCGWGEVLEAGLPSGLGVKIRTVYTARSPAGKWPEELVAPLSESARALVVQHVEWDAGQWDRAATPADHAWLRRHVRPGGAVALRQEFAGTRAKGRLEKWVRLAHPGTAAEVQEPNLRKRRNAQRESKREQVLRVLQEQGEVPLVRLKAAIGSPGGALRQLRSEGLVTEMLRPGARRDPYGPPPPRQEFLTLNSQQQAATVVLQEALTAQSYRGFLLQGVTGSGKTEVYLHTVREALAQGRNVLVLVPEIALTAEMVNRFRSRFGDAVAVLHSGLGEGERFDEWNRIRGSGAPDPGQPAAPHAPGSARIVIGARSAVFAPLSNLGLVIVDEEHDGSYKQDESPRYHGRDAAIWRASRAGAVLVLGTATPSLESVRNVELGKLTRLRLGERIENRPLPPVELVDLRTVARIPGAAFLGVPLIDALRETLARQEQAIVFLNRRGFASLVRCGACQTAVLCQNCSIALTWHQGERRLRCHRCDYTRALPEKCPACGAAEIKSLGLGTERIAQELAMLFPEARVLRVDSDSLRRRGELERVMGMIRKHQVDLIIGTQILSKGHDFPKITLVGAVLADVSLNLPDFRSPERTFQLLTQMAGRAGRGDRPGRVLIQTYNPDHYALTHVRTHDPDAFAAQELRVRENAGTPPFASQVLLWASSPSERGAERLAHALADRLQPIVGAEAQMLGPVEAPIKRLAGRFRRMLLLKGPRIGPLQRLVSYVLDDPTLKVAGEERIAVDVDPYSVL